MWTDVLVQTLRVTEVIVLNRKDLRRTGPFTEVTSNLFEGV